MSFAKRVGISFHRSLEQTGLDTLYIYYFRHRGQRRWAMIERYLGNGVSEKEKRHIARRMRYAFLRYGWKFDEYFMWDFENLTHKERKSFVPDLYKDYFCDRVNPQEYHKLFMDKGETYKRFSKYYKRNACVVHSWAQDGQAFVSFAKDAKDIIVKPLKESMGNGIKIFRNVNDAIVQVIKDEYPKDFIAEELIRQVDELSSLYPNSVNTVRITTLVIGDQVEIIRPFMKIGRGGCEVDNGGKGGLLCALDKEVGCITAVKDEMCVNYEVHPDTGETLIGFTLPLWKEAISMAKELALVIPECAYVGWDLALTDQGWVMVEGNSRGMFVGFQLPEMNGFRAEYDELMKKKMAYKRGTN